MAGHQDHSGLTVLTGRPTPLVSIIIPCYNQAHFLRECLESVRAQTIPGWEAIVVDDASPDGPEIEAVISSLDDPRIRLVRHPENRGLAAARNSGIREARAEIVACLDADDLLSEVYLERLLPLMVNDESLDCVFPDVVQFGNAGVKVVPTRVPTLQEILRRQPLLGAGFLMRRRLWERVGGYDEAEELRPGREDWEFYIRVFSQRVSAAHFRDALYRYRTSPSSMNLRCRTVEHKVCRYIYNKHRNLFDRARETRSLLGMGFDKATKAALAKQKKLSAMGLSLHALRFGITVPRLKRLAKAMLPDLLIGLIREARHNRVRRVRRPAEP